MSSFMNELHTAEQCRLASPDSEKPPPTDPWTQTAHDVPECYPEVSVPMAPSTDVSVFSIRVHPDQDVSSGSALDPFNPSRIQLTHAESLKPQLGQYHLLTGPSLGPSDSNSAAAMWISGGTYLSGATVDSHQQVAVDVDSQWIERGRVETSSCITHQVLCGDERGVHLPPSQLGYWSLMSNDVASAGKGDHNIFENPYQLASSRDEGGVQTSDKRSAASVHSSVRPEWDSKSRKACHCTRSRCLKLYCDCFSSGVMCSGCNCVNCHNNVENESQRLEAMKHRHRNNLLVRLQQEQGPAPTSDEWAHHERFLLNGGFSLKDQSHLCLGRNPNAFRSKSSARKLAESRSWHGKGCSCRHSGCLKKYCECYEANIKCTSSCRCVGCCNNDNLDCAAEPASAVTVESVCQSLLAEALHAERRSLSTAAAERLILEKFGHHLTQIVNKL